MRRAARYISIALSIGLLAALALPRMEATPERPKPPAAPAAQETPAAPAAVAAVRLPPPPAPKPAPAPVAKTITVTPLKPNAPKPPAPKVASVTPLKPTAKAAPAPVVRPPLRPSPPKPAAAAPESQTKAQGTVTPDAASVTEERALLRLLEHGSGPSIEIAWPESARARQRLFETFTRCFGLRVAVLAVPDRLYVADGAPGVPWPLNLDAYSGFMRQHGNAGAATEKAELRAIRARHGLPPDSAAVRIFPRQVDALLLGGLRQLVGPQEAGRQTIRARYRLTGGRVFVEDVRANGARLSGRIDLSPVAHRACRGGIGS